MTLCPYISLYVDANVTGSNMKIPSYKNNSDYFLLHLRIFTTRTTADRQILIIFLLPDTNVDLFDWQEDFLEIPCTCGFNWEKFLSIDNLYICAHMILTGFNSNCIHTKRSTKL